MGEILPDGSIQGYSGYCKKCKKEIPVNMQGTEMGTHDCTPSPEPLKEGISKDPLQEFIEYMNINHEWLKEKPEIIAKAFELFRINATSGVGMQVTAEEFFRNKLKEIYPYKENITLHRENIDAETGMRWAHEYHLSSSAEPKDEKSFIEFKTLKHKTLTDTYGCFVDGTPSEIYHSSIPILQPMSATIELMKECYKENIIISEQLESYELVTVKLIKPLF